MQFAPGKLFGWIHFAIISFFLDQVSEPMPQMKIKEDPGDDDDLDED